MLCSRTPLSTLDATPEQARLDFDGAQRRLDVSVAYARERVQFGGPIGSFQAVEHRCAHMLREVESARSAGYRAGG